MSLVVVVPLNQWGLHSEASTNLSRTGYCCTVTSRPLFLPKIKVDLETTLNFIHHKLKTLILSKRIVFGKSSCEREREVRGSENFCEGKDVDEELIPKGIS